MLDHLYCIHILLKLPLQFFALFIEKDNGIDLFLKSQQFYYMMRFFKTIHTRHSHIYIYESQLRNK